jgi:hypothetical protein
LGSLLNGVEDSFWGGAAGAEGADHRPVEPAQDQYVRVPF